MIRRGIALSALAVVAVSSLSFGLSRGQEPSAAPTPAAKSPFEGKILVVSVKSDTEYGPTLENPELKKIGDETFLVGTAFYDGAQHWSDGRKIWVAVSDVSPAMPNLELLREAR